MDHKNCPNGFFCKIESDECKECEFNISESGIVCVHHNDSKLERAVFTALGFALGVILTAMVL